jgi:hypothetical protein
MMEIQITSFFTIALPGNEHLSVRILAYQEYHPRLLAPTSFFIFSPAQSSNLVFYAGALSRE